MPSLGKYKSLGRSLGAYKAGKIQTQSLEYSKSMSDWQNQERKSMYAQVEGTLSNIVGIAKELKGLKKMREYEDTAKNLSGIGSKEIDENGKKVTIYFDKESGKEISTERLRAIGKQEYEGISTRFGEFKVPETPDTPDVKLDSGNKPESMDTDFTINEVQDSKKDYSPFQKIEKPSLMNDISEKVSNVTKKSSSFTRKVFDYLTDEEGFFKDDWLKY